MQRPTLAPSPIPSRLWLYLNNKVPHLRALFMFISGISISAVVYSLLITRQLDAHFLFLFAISNFFYYVLDISTRGPLASPALIAHVRSLPNTDLARLQKLLEGSKPVHVQEVLYCSDHLLAVNYKTDHELRRKYISVIDAQRHALKYSSGIKIPKDRPSARRKAFIPQSVGDLGFSLDGTLISPTLLFFFEQGSVLWWVILGISTLFALTLIFEISSYLYARRPASPDYIKYLAAMFPNHISELTDAIENAARPFSIYDALHFEDKYTNASDYQDNLLKMQRAASEQPK